MHDQKIVDFEYCRKCKHFLKPENEEPCSACLNTFTNAYSHKPVNFEEGENKNVLKVRSYEVTKNKSHKKQLL